MNQNLLPGLGLPNSAQQQQQIDLSSSSVNPSTIPTHSALRISGHTTFVPPHSIISGGQNQQSPSSSFLHQPIAGIYYNQPQIATTTTEHRTIMPGSGFIPVTVGQPAATNVTMKKSKLQVDDALSYLERVRQQFVNTPERYNEFLEVMKLFKSHTIDTTGVIHRVSALFQEHPDLINGFNTFLPPGFEVHVTVTPAGNHIKIHQPNGTIQSINTASTGQQIIEVGDTSSMQQLQIQPAPMESTSRPLPANITNHQGSPPRMHSPKRKATELGSPVIMHTSTGANLSSKHRTFTNSQSHQQMTLTTAAQNQLQLQQIIVDSACDNRAQQVSATTQQQQQQFTITAFPIANQLEPQQQPIHFSEALGYLNKIKERFSARPEVYQQFLTILGNYQRSDGNQKLTESGVYQEVAKLFQNEEDLMRDFKSFLPDASLELTDLQSKELSQQMDLVENENQGGGGVKKDGKWGTATTSANWAGKKRSIAKSLTAGGEHISSKKAKGQYRIVYDTSMSEILKEIPLKDFMFFQKVQNALQDETIFTNFMRCLALYSKSIMSKSELFVFVKPFLISYPELLKEFEDILGGNSEINRHPKKQIPLEDRLPSEKAYEIDFTHSKRVGVSYRSLPEDYEQPICTGRTELCNKVLNDKWTCYPTWSSEDTSVTKKSTFEEVMCRTEDERFEVDILIETNSSTIYALEYAESKIASMSTEEARKWMIENENNLGCSYTVVCRAVRKLYGECAHKILSALRENALVAIPQVLLRLRNKDIEWKSVREEYNVIWRDQVEKNYLKSLDHQALTFKANDIKNIRTRNIITQLETVYEERREKAEQGQATEWGPHLCIEYPEDLQIFQDANELILNYVKRHMNSREKKAIENLLSSLIFRLFMLQGHLASSDERPEESEITEATMTQETQSLTLNKDGNEGQDSEEINPKMPSSSHSAPSSTNATTPTAAQQLIYILFFGTNSWLLFIRLHAILCDRLAIIKRKTEELVEEYNTEIKFQERQKEVYKKYGNTPEAHQLNAVDVHLGLRELKKPTQNPENFYQIMLQETKNLLDGSIENANFEDTLRSMFETKAYILFTMDKLVSTIALHLKTFSTDNSGMKCLALFDDYYKKRINGCEQGALAKQADTEYQSDAEKLLINEKCYKMYFLKHDYRIVTVQLVDTNEPESESDEEVEEKESSNVVALPDWSDFLKNNGIDEEGLAARQKQLRSGIMMKRNVRYRYRFVERLRADATKNAVNADLGDREKDKEANSEASHKGKMPHFFASSGFCSLLNEQRPVQVLKEASAWGLDPDIVVRKGAPGIGRKRHRKISLARRKRWINWLEKQEKDQIVSARWLSDGSQTRICTHPRFKYLKFTKYTSTYNTNTPD